MHFSVFSCIIQKKAVPLQRKGLFKKAYELFTGIISNPFSAAGGCGPRMRVGRDCVSPYAMRMGSRRDCCFDHIE